MGTRLDDFLSSSSTVVVMGPGVRRGDEQNHCRLLPGMLR